MSSRRLALCVLTAGTLIVGVWAQCWPASFYSSFPAGRAWVAVDGPYNEHLIRDVGGLNLALSLLTAVAAYTLRADHIRLAAAASLLFAVPHLAYHALHLDPYGTADVAGNLAGLGTAVVLPIWLVVSPAPPARPATLHPDGGARDT